MAVFALVHIYWLLDGRVGLPGGESIYVRPALVVIDVIAIPLCMAGVALACSLCWPSDRRPSPRARLGMMVATAAVLLLHTFPTVPTWVQLALANPLDLTPEDRFITYLYEPFFFAGGVACAAAAIAYRRHSGTSRRRSRRPASGADG